MLGLALLVLSSTAAPAAGATPAKDPARTRLVILDLSANDVDGAIVKTISESIAVTLQHAHVVDDVVSAADLRAMMNVEAGRRSSGATCEAGDACMAEIATALGADVLVHGSVGRFGSLYSVTLSLFDARRSRAIAREKAESERLEDLSKEVEAAARRLAAAYTGEPPPPATASSGPSPVLLWGGVGATVVGVAAGVVGGVLVGGAIGTVGDPDSSGADKQSATAAHPLYVTTLVAGAALAAGGAGLVAAAFLLE